MRKKEEEVKLLEDLKKGDERAISAIHKLCWKEVFYSAFGIVGNEQDAKDIAQETFISLWAKRESLEIEYFRTYLSRTARNKAINFMEKKKNDEIRHRKASMHQDATQASPEYSALAADEQAAREALLMKGVEKMPKKRRHVFTEVILKGKERQEVADSAKLALRTVESHLAKGVSFLKDFVKKKS